METNNQNKMYKEYMDFCDKYGEQIESSLNTLRNFISEIPKDATLYVRSDVIEQTIKNLKEINEWIVETKQLSEEDFDYE